MKIWLASLPVLLLLVFAAGLDLARKYWLNRDALARGYGEGRSTLGWLLGGFGFASPLALFRPRSQSVKPIEMENLPCPDCNVPRDFYQGFCTVCGCEVVRALIEQARRDEAAESGLPLSVSSAGSAEAGDQAPAIAPAALTATAADYSAAPRGSTADLPEANSGERPRLNL